MFKPRTAKTFLEYGDPVFYPFIESKLRYVSKVDVVFDQYLPDSLKETARQKRGKGVRRRVSEEIKIPSNWQAFLRIDENKNELLYFLAEFLQRQPAIEGKRIYITNGQDVLTNPLHLDTTSLAPCNQEEADSRIFLYVANAVNEGLQKVTIRTVDTDVVVWQFPSSNNCLFKNCGFHLAQEGLSNTLLLMLYAMVLEMTRLKPFPVFTVSPDVTLYLLSVEKERNQPGRPGKYMVR